MKVRNLNVFTGERSPLIDYNAWDISADDLDDYGYYEEGGNTFYVEGGSDGMGDMYGTIYKGNDDDDDWWDNEELADHLNEFFNFLIKKAVIKKYGDNVNIEYY
jgi:hypothetical protein